MFDQRDELPKEPLILTIFGATSDLTHRKLLPALYHLRAENRLPDQIRILLIGRRDLSGSAYRGDAEAAIRRYSRTSPDEQKLSSFLDIISYYKMEFISDPESYAGLSRRLKEEETAMSAPAVRLFFLAVAPEHFAPIVERLRDKGLAEKGNADHRVMIEKPFGSDLETARALNRTISKALDEKQVYRIDHYLGKEMIRNILAIRFANSLFEPLWNHHYIDNIQITSFETLGVEGRRWN